MRGDIEEMPKKKKPKGYAFYHMQDTDSAVEGGGIYIKFGVVEDGEEAETAIGQTIADALGKAGLKVTWNGSPNEAVGLLDFDWKKRR